jgi:hypothetical protein
VAGIAVTATVIFVVPEVAGGKERLEICSELNRKGLCLKCVQFLSYSNKHPVFKKLEVSFNAVFVQYRSLYYVHKHKQRLTELAKMLNLFAVK